VLARPFEVRAGHLHLPDVPGNGLDWDESALTHYQQPPQITPNPAPEPATARVDVPQVTPGCYLRDIHELRQRRRGR
jgi:hypothetical protein